MNIQVGKSAGIALLMAAALLAALFAMGVFAPAGVEAGVYVAGDRAPTVKLVDGSGNTVITTDALQENLSLVIEFEVSDTVDGQGSDGVGADDSVTISWADPPGSTVVIPTLTATNTMVTQDGNSVGNLDVTTPTSPARINISHGGGTDALVANERVTVTITGVQFTASAVLAAQEITIEQDDSEGMASYSVANVNAAPTGASAALGTTAGTLVIKFTPRDTGEIVVNPAVNYLLTTSNVNIDGTAATDTQLGTAGQITLATADLTVDTEVVITISSLFNVAAGDMITLSQADTGYSATFEVDGDAVSPSTGVADDGEMGTFDFSTKKAGAAVKISLTATATEALAGGDDIIVDLSGFGVPSSIDENDVQIDGNDGGTDGTEDDGNATIDFRGNPEEVAVNGSKITLTLPLRQDNQDGSGTGTMPTVVDGMYQITFKQSAGLTNPNSAGLKTITVSDEDDDADEFKVLIASTVSLEPKSGFVTRGGDATITAKGLRDGTTTVYLLMMNDDDEYERGAVLGNGRADDGVVMIDLDTSLKALKADAEADGNKDMGVNMLRVIDSNNDPVGDDIVLGIKPTVKLGSETAKRSASLEISVSDWYYGDIEEVTIAGLDAGIEGDDDVIDVGSDMTRPNSR